MKLAFVLDPLDTIKTYKDSSYAMMEEAARRGHALFVLHQEGLLCRDGEVRAAVWPIELTGDKYAWHRLGERRETALAEFDAVLMRKDPPFDIEYIYSTYLLELAQRQGARVVNDPRALRDYNEKFSITRFTQFTVPTLVTRLEEEIRGFLAEHRDIVLKPLDGMGGASVFRLHDADHNIGVVIETLARAGVGSLVLADFDAFELSNFNRQILATLDTLGRSKTEVARERLILVHSPRWKP